MTFVSWLLAASTTRRSSLAAARLATDRAIKQPTRPRIPKDTALPLRNRLPERISRATIMKREYWNVYPRATDLSPRANKQKTGRGPGRDFVGFRRLFTTRVIGSLCRIVRPRLEKRGHVRREACGMSKISGAIVAWVGILTA